MGCVCQVKKAGKTGIEPEYRGIITPVPALGLRF
jgi:hypothetical protein